jgi:precorrin-4 methylase
MNNYARAQERIGREIDTMDLKELNKYLGHMKPLISAMIIDTIREELKKQMQAQEGPVEIKVKYSDTDQTNRREALKLLQEWGYDEPPEDIIN